MLNALLSFPDNRAKIGVVSELLPLIINVLVGFAMPIPKFPETNAPPVTCSLDVGFVVPMPILPLIRARLSPCPLSKSFGWWKRTEAGITANVPLPGTL